VGIITDTAKEIFTYNEYMNRLAKTIDQEIQDLKRDIRNGSIYSDEPPQAPLPPEQWKFPDMVSYVSQGHEDKKVWGLFHHLDKNDVWAYWQDRNGNFRAELGWISKYEVTFEFRPEK